MKTFLLPFALLLSIASVAQTGYDVKFQIKNNTDSTMYLVRTIFDKQYISDTCKKVKNGLVQFKGKKILDKGVYTLVSQEKSVYFDFLINDSYNFTVSFDRNDIVNSLKSYGSKENEDMFAYLKFMTNKNGEFIKAKDQSKKMNKADSTKFVMEKFEAMTKDVVKFEEAFMKKVKGTFTYDFLNMKSEKEAKEVPKASNGRPDSLWRYYYYKNHFFDGVDFKDKRIVTIPFFDDRVKRYLDGVIFQYSPDSLIKELDWMLGQCVTNELVYNLLLGHFTYKYEQDKRMSFDKVFVHLADNYILNGKANEVYSEETVKAIKKRVDVLRNLLIDSKASELYMIDTVDARKVIKMGFDTVISSKSATELYYKNIDKLTPMFKTLYMVNAKFTVLVFWDVDCSHCQTEIPKLHEELKKIKDKIDYKVVSVYTKEEFEKWRKYIIEKKLTGFYHLYDPIHLNNIKDKYDIISTPVIYVLDKDKLIKGKKISADQVVGLLEYLNSLEKTQGKK
ncbi:MAG: thioredoxin-like domain-containing protein [Bacteroidota bacterium]|nr:thioredoxin-like domain-containing protein [Bacteroidota bacterium]